MDERQKRLVILALRRAFACKPHATSDGGNCLLTDEQLELLFNAISLSVALGPYTGKQELKSRTAPVDPFARAHEAFVKGSHSHE